VLAWILRCSNGRMASLENFRLVVFRAVAEQLSFRKAAEELYLTQPAVTFQIKALEEDLGVQLFDRAGAHVALTPAGTALLKRANQARALLAEAEQEIAALTGDLAGELTLGVSTTISQYVLPRILRAFAKEYPRCRFSVISGNTEHIVKALEEQRVALGLIEGPARSRAVSCAAFMEDELVLIAPAAHEWADAESISCAELAAAPLLMREHGSGTRHVVEMALERCGLKGKALHVAMELDSTEAIKSAVEAGLGVGFVSRWALAKDVRLGRQIRVIPVAGLEIRRKFLLASSAGPERGGLPREFRRYLLARSTAADDTKPSRSRRTS
jgi:LysR family transcriptional regulator, transcriptional activator of the cysJI operon